MWSKQGGYEIFISHLGALVAGLMLNYVDQALAAAVRLTVHCSEVHKLQTLFLPIPFQMAGFSKDVVSLWYGVAISQPCHFGGWVGIDEDGKLCFLQKADIFHRKNPTVVQNHKGILL